MPRKPTVAITPTGPAAKEYGRAMLAHIEAWRRENFSSLTLNLAWPVERRLRAVMRLTKLTRREILFPVVESLQELALPRAKRDHNEFLDLLIMALREKDSYPRGIYHTYTMPIPRPIHARLRKAAVNADTKMSYLVSIAVDTVLSQL